MKIIYSVLMVVIFSSCATYTYKSVSGEYCEIHNMFEGGSTIKLNEDSTFLYRRRAGLLSWETPGKWEIKGNRLILNGNLLPLPMKIPYRPLDTINVDNSGFVLYNLPPQSQIDEIVLDFEEKHTAGIRNFSNEVWKIRNNRLIDIEDPYTAKYRKLKK